eukprot:6428662-Amphidinium_carterae.1
MSQCNYATSAIVDYEQSLRTYILQYTSRPEERRSTTTSMARRTSTSNGSETTRRTPTRALHNITRESTQHVDYLWQDTAELHSTTYGQPTQVLQLPH